MVEPGDSTLEGMQTLLVEDDAASAWLLFELLVDAGCHVRMAASAEEAAAVLRESDTRLMVLDLVLPRMGGLTLARTLTHSRERGNLVIVAVSAMDATSASRLAIEAGCDAFVPKPIDPYLFTATLGRLIRRTDSAAPKQQ